MAMYLWRVSYTTAGAEGLLAQGGTARRGAIQKALESLGGTLESFHYALGEDDAHLLDDVQRVCEQVVMLDAGRLVVSGATGTRAAARRPCRECCLAWSPDLQPSRPDAV